MGQRQRYHILSWSLFKFIFQTTMNIRFHFHYRFVMSKKWIILIFTQATIEINIEDVNDNNPKFKEPFYKFLVTENSKFGILIGTVLAEDPDENKTISYSIESTSELANLIYLDADHGDIVVANKIDREENEWVNLTVGSGEFSKLNLTIYFMNSTFSHFFNFIITINTNCYW